MSQRHIARVADGFIILTMDGVVSIRSPERHQLLLGVSVC